MSSYTHYFTVEREVDGEPVEYELTVECYIEIHTGSRRGFAEIDGPVYTLDDDGNRSIWDGSLTSAEINKVEHDAYENWLNNVDDSDPDVDEEVGHFDSYDPEDQVFRTANGGKVYY